ncbi:MAG: glycosyltransferase family A protein, partial [Bacteroidales bacterium]|nr:glycosyltransferase family A protein [Bacteroidales bacterium]
MGNNPGDYNKHKAWNIGVSSSSGDIVVLCDSDVMFQRSFIQNIIDFFVTQNDSFLLIDEIRSENKSFWPFCYPTWEEVLAAPDVINWNELYGVTNGLIPE